MALQQFQVGFACGTHQPIDQVYIHNITDSVTNAWIPYNDTSYRANTNFSCAFIQRLLFARSLQQLGGVDLTIQVINPSTNLTTLNPTDLQTALTPVLTSVLYSVGATGFSLATPDTVGAAPIVNGDTSSNSMLVSVLVPIATLAVLTVVAALTTVYLRRAHPSRISTRTVRIPSEEMPIKPRVSRSESVRVMLSPLQVRV